MNDVVLVVDIGSTKTVCLAAEQGADSRLKVLGFAQTASQGVVKSTVQDPERAAHAVGSVYARVSEELGKKGMPVVVTVGGCHVRCASTQGFFPIYPPGRAVRREDVLQVVNHSRQIVLGADYEQIQALPREFRLDGEKGLGDPVGKPTSRLEVLTCLLTGHSDTLHKLETVFSILGIRLEEMVVGGLVSGISALKIDQLQRGALCVDLGHSSMSLALFQNGSLAWTGTLPVGSRHITSDIAQLLKVSLTEAERLKVEQGFALPESVDSKEVVQVLQEDQDQPRPMPRKVLSEIVHSRVLEMATMARKQMESSGFEQPVPEVVLVGGGSELAGVDRVFGTVFRTECRRGKLSLVGMRAREVESPANACAVGTARFVLEARDDGFEPVNGLNSWKDRIHALRTRFGVRRGS